MRTCHRVLVSVESGQNSVSVCWRRALASISGFGPKMGGNQSKSRKGRPTFCTCPFAELLSNSTDSMKGMKEREGERVCVKERARERESV